MTDELLQILCTASVFLAVAVGIYPVIRAWDALTWLYLRDMWPSLEAAHLEREQVYVTLRWCGFLLFGSVVLLLVFQMPLLALAAAVVICALPRLWLSYLVKRHRRLLRDQIVGACIGMANAARAGLSLDLAMQSAADEAPMPLSFELQRIWRDHQGGIPLAEAINTAKDRLDIDTFSIFGLTIVTCLEQGGQVTEILERIGKSVGETQRLERRVDSETAAGRKVIWVLAIFPLIFLTVMALLHPSGTRLMFTTLPGQGLLVFSLILISVSIAWSRQILTIKF
ncbi:MAG: type II secretion system F family protein [Pirellulaceae bacterium]